MQAERGTPQTTKRNGLLNPHHLRPEERCGIKLGVTLSSCAIIFRAVEAELT
jgi:hypothetical protein